MAGRVRVEKRAAQGPPVPEAYCSEVVLLPPAPAAPLERIPVRQGEDVLLVPVAQLVSVVADGEVLRG